MNKQVKGNKAPPSKNLDPCNCGLISNVNRGENVKTPVCLFKFDYPTLTFTTHVEDPELEFPLPSGRKKEKKRAKDDQTYTDTVTLALVGKT